MIVGPTDAQLATIFATGIDCWLPTREELYLANCAVDYMRRAVNAETLAEFQAYRLAYRRTERALVEMGVWE